MTTSVRAWRFSRWIWNCSGTGYRNPNNRSRISSPLKYSVRRNYHPGSNYCPANCTRPSSNILAWFLRSRDSAMNCRIDMSWRSSLLIKGFLARFPALSLYASSGSFSGAQTAHVDLNGTGAALTVRISDTGVGFDPTSDQAQRGLGLVSMRERLRAMGGNIFFTRLVPNGTQVDVRVPLPVQDEISGGQNH